MDGSTAGIFGADGHTHTRGSAIILNDDGRMELRTGHQHDAASAQRFRFFPTFLMTIPRIEKLILYHPDHGN